MRSGRTPVMRAAPWAESVSTPLCEPVNEIASTPRSCSAIASSAIDTRSPVVSSMSSSRRLGAGETSRASASSSSVVWPIADTTTTVSLPAARAAATRRATARMRSAPSTEVPPYFWTSKGMGALYPSPLRIGTPLRARLARGRARALS